MFEDKTKDLNSDPSMEAEGTDAIVNEDATPSQDAPESVEPSVPEHDAAPVEDADAEAVDADAEAADAAAPPTSETANTDDEERQPKQKALPIPSEEDLEELGYTLEQFTEMAEMYDSTLKSIDEGELVKGIILSINDSEVMVDIGFKSEGRIAIDEFPEPQALAIGDEISVLLEATEGADGEVKVSKRKADFLQVWDKIKEAHDDQQVVDGIPKRRIKGGLKVDLFGVEAFLPGSQVALRRIPNLEELLGQKLQFRILKVNKRRRNIVISRRVVLEEERQLKKEALLKELEVGQIRQGGVKNITDFGAFVDLGGIDGLLHITDMSWGRIRHPSELVAIGDDLTVKVLNFDPERERISLGLKQLAEYPWENVEEEFAVGSRVRGKVVSITDYGAFVELKEGVEGLIHISEMSWTQHIRHPSKILGIGDIVEVKILNVNKAEEKVSLSLKRTENDPWQDLDTKYPVGTKIEGRVRNLTDFGAFVQLEEGMDGLVHISDMSWTKRIKHPSEVLHRGQKVEIMVLGIDKDRHRISLGIKQCLENPWPELAEQYAVGTEVSGTVSRIHKSGIVVELPGDVEGFVPMSHLALNEINRIEARFATSDELPLEVIEVSSENRRIVLSVRIYMEKQPADVHQEYLNAHGIRPELLEPEPEEEAPVADDAPVADAEPQEAEAETAEEGDVEPTADEAIEDGEAETAETETAEEGDVEPAADEPDEDGEVGTETADEADVEPAADEPDEDGEVEKTEE
ncbi:30S ribosomal protein S1 [bacterium]|nr:30S ribosomal protein S1 [bacterium]